MARFIPNRSREWNPAILACVALLFSLPAEARTVRWTGNAGTPDWKDGGNWSPGSPATGDDVVIESGTGAPVIKLDRDATIRSLQIGATGTMQLEVVGRSLRILGSGGGSRTRLQLGPSGRLVVGAGGSVEVVESVGGSSGPHRLYEAMMEISGSIQIAGSLILHQPLAIGATGSLELLEDDARLQIRSDQRQILNYGTIRSLSGTGAAARRIQCDLTNLGLIEVSRPLSVDGSLVNQEAGTVRVVGGSLSAADFTAEAGGTVAIRIGGLAPGTEHGRIEVDGAAILGGELDPEFVNGFVPEDGHQFVVIEGASVSGRFARVACAGAPGVACLEPVYQSEMVRLMVPDWRRSGTDALAPADPSHVASHKRFVPRSDADLHAGRDEAGRQALSFGIRGIQPNPAPGPMSVRFALPSAAPAKLELFDVAGRRVLAKDLTLGAGQHTVRVDEGARMAAGVYLVRLSQLERTATARAIIQR